MVMPSSYVTLRMVFRLLSVFHVRTIACFQQVHLGHVTAISKSCDRYLFMKSMKTSCTLLQHLRVNIISMQQIHGFAVYVFGKDVKECEDFLTQDLGAQNLKCKLLHNFSQCYIFILLFKYLKIVIASRVILLIKNVHYLLVAKHFN